MAGKILIGMGVISYIGLTLDFFGKILIGLSVLLVHRRMVEERKIDSYVLEEMRREQIIAVLGIVLMSVGYVLRLFGV